MAHHWKKKIIFKKFWLSRESTFLCFYADSKLRPCIEPSAPQL